MLHTRLQPQHPRHSTTSRTQLTTPPQSPSMTLRTPSSMQPTSPKGQSMKSRTLPTRLPSPLKRPFMKHKTQLTTLPPNPFTILRMQLTRPLLQLRNPSTKPRRPLLSEPKRTMSMSLVRPSSPPQNPGSSLAKRSAPLLVMSSMLSMSLRMLLFALPHLFSSPSTILKMLLTKPPRPLKSRLMTPKTLPTRLLLPLRSRSTRPRRI